MERGQQHDSPTNSGYGIGTGSLLRDEHDGEHKSCQNGEAEPDFHVRGLVRELASLSG